MMLAGVLAGAWLTLGFTLLPTLPPGPRSPPPAFRASASRLCADDELAFVRSVLRAESSTLDRLADELDATAESWRQAIELVASCEGHVVVAGMGKSGLVGAKISATLSSLGRPSHTLHPAEAVHGDLGRIRRGDVALLLSYSGETEEVVALASIERLVANQNRCSRVRFAVVNPDKSVRRRNAGPIARSPSSASSAAGRAAMRRLVLEGVGPRLWSARGGTDGVSLLSREEFLDRR